MSVPKTGSRFGAYEFARNSLFPEDSWGKDSRLRSLFCGLTAGVTEAIVAVTPMETVKTKLIHDKVAGTGKYNGLIGGVSTIVKLEGMGGLYRGKYICSNGDYRAYPNDYETGLESGCQVFGV
jgi:solute carrier family 25 citrate transporter 1